MLCKKTPTLLQHLGIKKQDFSSNPLYGGPAFARVTEIIKGFHENGGLCRQETVGQFEERHGYSPEAASNSCYDSAVGLLVSGYCQTNPGMHADIPRGAGQPIYVMDIEHVYKEDALDDKNLKRFGRSFTQALKKDGLQTDISMNDIGHYFPIITFYGEREPHLFSRSKYDYHAVVPHLADHKLTYSDRPGHEVYPEEYKSVIDLFRRNPFCIHNLHTAQVHFVPNDYMGTRIETVSENAPPLSMLNDILIFDLEPPKNGELPSLFKILLDNMVPPKEWLSSPKMGNEPA